MVQSLQGLFLFGNVSKAPYPSNTLPVENLSLRISFVDFSVLKGDKVCSNFFVVAVDLLDFAKKMFRILELIQYIGQEGLIVKALDNGIRNAPKLNKLTVEVCDFAAFVYHQYAVCG